MWPPIITGLVEEWRLGSVVRGWHGHSEFQVFQEQASQPNLSGFGSGLG